MNFRKNLSKWINLKVKYIKKFVWLERNLLVKLLGKGIRLVDWLVKTYNNVAYLDH